MRLAFRLTRYNRYSFVPLFTGVRDVAEIFLCESFEDLLAVKPDAVLYSFMSPHACEMLEEMGRLKEVFPDVLVVVGGPHSSALPDEVLEGGADAVVVGEAEGVWSEVLRDLSSGSLKRIYKKTLSDFPRYSLVHSPYTAPIELVRGCPFGCRFCQVSYLFGRRARSRKMAEVLREVRVLKSRGRRFVRFIAPNALSYMSEDGVSPNVEVLEELFSRIREEGVEQIFFGSFPSELRPESVNEEAVSLMARFCHNRRVVVGVQSGSDECLRMIGRGHTVADAVRAVEILNRFGFLVVLDFIFGFPGETEAQMRETVSFIEFMLANYRVEVNAHAFMPLPGTPFSGKRPAELPRWLKRWLHEQERRGLVKGNWAQQDHIRGMMWKRHAYLSQRRQGSASA